jgi:hypothetical protein
MAFIFTAGQVAVSDPATGGGPQGPTATSNIKDVVVKAVKLTSANFGTSAVNTKVAVLPADASIIRLSLWTNVQLAGGGITAASISIGTVSAGTQIASAISTFATAGTYALVTPVTNIVQNYNIPYGLDQQIWVSGTATTGNPTSGEVYLLIEYIR